MITLIATSIIMARLIVWIWTLKKKENKVIWWLDALFLEEKRDDSHGLQHALEVRDKATELFLLGFLSWEWEWVWLAPHFWFFIRIAALVHDVLDGKYPDPDGSRRKKLIAFLTQEFGEVWAGCIMLICDNCSWTKEKNAAKQLYNHPDEEGPSSLKISDWRKIFSEETSIKYWIDYLMWVRFLVKEGDDVAGLGFDHGRQGYERCRLFGQEVCNHNTEESLIKHAYDVFVTRVNYYPRFMHTRFGKMQVTERLLQMQEAWLEDWSKLSAEQQSVFILTGQIDPKKVSLIHYK